MTSFLADFAILARVDGYGGAEVHLARRVLDEGLGDAVHLARFPGGALDDALLYRLLGAAGGAAALAVDRVVPLDEILRVDDDLLAAARAVQGVALDAVLADDARAGRKPFLPFCLAVATSIARIVESVHERGDVWAPASGASLLAALPHGLVPGGVVLGARGDVHVRVLGALVAPGVPEAFLAPELARGDPPRPASDVYSVGKLLRALLSGDPLGEKPARSGLGRTLTSVLRSALEEDPGLRCDVVELREALEEQLYEARSSSTHAIIAEVLAERHAALLPRARQPVRVDDRALLRARRGLAKARAAVETLFPATRVDGDTFPPIASAADLLSQTDVTRTPVSARSSAADGVFTGEGPVPSGGGDDVDVTILLEAVGRGFDSLPSETDPDEPRTASMRPRALRKPRSSDFKKPEGSRGLAARPVLGDEESPERRTILAKPTFRAVASSASSFDHDDDEKTSTGPGGGEAAPLPTLRRALPPDLPTTDPGSLVVEAPEGAVVFVNGNELGRGELTLRGLDRFARYVVRVHLAGHTPWSAVVTLGGKPWAKVRPRLQRR